MQRCVKKRVGLRICLQIKKTKKNKILDYSFKNLVNKKLTFPYSTLLTLLFGRSVRLKLFSALIF